MVWQRLVGLRVHSKRCDITAQSDRGGAVPGAVRNAASYPFRPLRRAADPGQHGDRGEAKPGQRRPGTGSRGGKFPPPGFRGARDENVFLRKEFGTGIVPE